MISFFRRVEGEGGTQYKDAWDAASWWLEEEKKNRQIV